MSSRPSPHRRHEQRVAIQATTRNAETRRATRTPYGTDPLKHASRAPSARVVLWSPARHEGGGPVYFAARSNTLRAARTAHAGTG
jgi:hypothetical protein